MRLGAVTAVSQVHQLAAGHARLCHGIQSATQRVTGMEWFCSHDIMFSV